ncbi:MAG: NADH-quinone oxidoreductase subunit C [Verrucomicrobia bacterium]|nr:NADH-quinone oxidoreductase subunit C [Verrucomicrobiota bacterium]
MSPLEQAKKLVDQFAGMFEPPVEFRGEVTLKLKEADRIADVCSAAKHRLGFDALVDLSSLDNYGEDPRFTLVYELYSYASRCHLRLKTDVNEERSELPTVTAIWRTAEWHEREIYDMMGIRFRGHPDLRRILMWEGYPYFPLRKDFPLAGKPTDLPDIAFTRPAPLEGGPFVTAPGGKNSIAREPRVRIPESHAPPFGAPARNLAEPGGMVTPAHEPLSGR